MSSNRATVEFAKRVDGRSFNGHATANELYDVCNTGTGTIAIFVTTRDAPPYIDTALRHSLDHCFDIPGSFWTDVAQQASGFCGAQDSHAEDGTLEVYSTFFRFLIKEPREQTAEDRREKGILYDWLRLGFFTQWRPSKRAVVLCFDATAELSQHVRAWVTSADSQKALVHPYVVHANMMHNVSERYDKALWACRDLVRNLEKDRKSPNNSKPDYVNMHEIERHAIHSSEVLARALGVMSSLLVELSIFMAENPQLSAEATRESKKASKVFRYERSILECLHLRSLALEKRLRNEINLAFNVVTQYDSAAMKTISILGLIFLPGTFVSAIFSMSFFNFTPAEGDEPQHYRVSESFWIYWIITIPVTLVTVSFWLSWQRAGSAKGWLHRFQRETPGGNANKLQRHKTFGGARSQNEEPKTDPLFGNV